MDSTTCDCHQLLGSKPNREVIMNEERKDQEEIDRDFDHKNTCMEWEAILPTLPKQKGWMGNHLVQYQGVWLSLSGLKGVMLARDHFKSLPTDIFLSTSPKAGTTWFKAILFTIMNRRNYQFSSHPLLTTNPHDLVLFIEAMFDQTTFPSPVKDDISSPRLLSTHMPYSLLPNSIKTSGCRIVYVCRDPKDALISQWQYLKKLRPKEMPPLLLEEAFELFRDGVSHFGPFWDHSLGYYRASQESPKKVLVLTYEAMMVDPTVNIKRLADFIGHPLDPEEESGGVVERMVSLCSFENLSSLEVNKSGVQQFTAQFKVPNSNFFRKGQIGDWRNHLTPTMAESLNKISKESFGGSDLEFLYS
ncbi:cytosolic sulfotransferase 13-like isoform X2 [Syzygium oleosum]|nr:cytosolic sulfotransferase 13-like isoform X2 [Syzygium oleosum]XP_056174825.1 cytosolic sulfotransferase 13-like isoform X2 [Syzygium oleosum]XP_056174826.1 cytosolic sulfotransferase 13-like isoform X2 [Syzygium oleosum]